MQYIGIVFTTRVVTPRLANDEDMLSYFNYCIKEYSLVKMYIVTT